MTSFGTWLTTWFWGIPVGEDEIGNIYYEHKKIAPDGRRRRWVIYKSGLDEASEIPAAWHAWIHYVTDEVPKVTQKRRWQKRHRANMTGTSLAYRPPGHFLQGAKRDKATGDYDAWQP